jgi:competence protein ComEC
MAAQITTLPVILLNFERFSLIAPVANVLVVPLVPLVMLTSAVAGLTGAAAATLPLVGDLLAWAAGGAAWLYLRLMVLAGQGAAAVPLASLDVTAPGWLAAVWYPALIVARHRIAGTPRELSRADEALCVGGFATRIGRPLPLTAATLLVVGALTFLTRPDGRLHLVALDIGQGDAILIVAPSGRTALIDGGPDPDLTMRRLGEQLPFWQRRLDVLVLSHPHEDHVAGLVPALERFVVGAVSSRVATTTTRPIPGSWRWRVPNRPCCSERHGPETSSSWAVRRDCVSSFLMSATPRDRCWRGTSTTARWSCCWRAEHFARC